MLTAVKEKAPVSDIDPFSREFLADPYPYHEQLRNLGPVVFLSKYNVWGVFRYQQVHAVLSDWQTYCSGAGVGISNFHKEGNWRQPSMLLETDPPVHTKARAIMSRVLSPAALQRLKEGFYRGAVEALERVINRDSFDAVADLGIPYPLKVFPDAVGLSSEGREHLLAYGDMAFNTMGPKNEFYMAAMSRAAEVIPWISKRCERAELAPGGLGADVYKAADAGELTEQEAALLVRSFLTAGVDTTVNALGNAIYCFVQNPDQWDYLRQNPTKARAAFEEVMRAESPFQAFFRTTTRPVTIDGIQIGESEKIYVSCGAANRDERRWENPARFDLQRKTAGHVGFGTGIHGCVGQMIARLELEMMLKAMIERIETIELAGKPQRLLHNTLRALSVLPVRMRRAN
jgi:4-methoxybenzoate monooxygenase (O-demethylating)